MSFQLHYGDSGHQLVQAHLNSLQIINGFVNGDHEDIVAKIGGIWRTFQVRASATSKRFHSSEPDEHQSRGKLFTQYEVDAFAFCFLPDMLIRYIAKAAVEDTMSFSYFSRQMRDDSFNDLLNRWGLPPMFIGGEMPLFTNPPPEMAKVVSISATVIPLRAPHCSVSETMHHIPQAKFPGW